MKKLLSILLLIVLCTALALAEGETCPAMEVVNCKEWVSLREKPDTTAERLAKVPLGAEVRDCVRVSDDFWQVVYQEQSGYILADYLQPVGASRIPEGSVNAIPYRELLGGGDVVLRYEDNPSVTIIATVDYSDGECLRVACYRKDNTPV